MNNLEQINKLLETFNLQTLIQEEIEGWDQPIMSKEIETVIKYLPRKKNPGADDQMASQINSNNI